MEQYIRKKKLLHRGAIVLVGVSGGPDSMALLHLLVHIRHEWNLRLVAVTIDHGLRGEESREDTAYVKKKCADWGVECIETFLDVPAYRAEHGIGTQAAAREMRYSFFEKKMEQLQADYLALGHHADDQAETMMMRFVRHTNPSVLRGMQEKRKFSRGFLIRPLFVVEKQEVEEYLAEHGIEPRRDPSNLEDAYTRNYFRLHVLPLLKAQNPQLPHHLQRLSRKWGEDEEYLEEQAKEVVEKAVSFSEIAKGAVIEIDAFLAFPRALQRRAFHLILTYLYRNIPKDIDYVHEDQFFDLLSSTNPNATVNFPAGLKLIKAYDQLAIRFPQPQSAPYQRLLKIPGRLALPNGSIIYASMENSPDEKSRQTFTFDASGIELPLIVRTRKSGDRMHVKGMRGTKKLKDIFIDEKIPKQERDEWPVVTDSQGRIIWLAGLKKGMVDQKEEPAEFIKLCYDKNGDV